MKSIKIPIKEVKKINTTVQLDAMSLASTKIAVDNDTSALISHLKKQNFRHVVEVPKFEEHLKRD